MRRRVFAALSSFLFYLSTLSPASAATPITSSMVGTTLSKGVYEVTSNLQLDASSLSTAGKSALAVAPGATVAVHVPAGVTLTLKGGKGSGATPGGAGFEVPTDSTLILVGEGTVNATGGKGGSAGGGGVGGSCQYVSRGTGKYDEVIGGTGGAGGAGAGGSGAGIGGRGGNGGSGGSVRSGPSTHERYCRSSGYTGNAGGTGGTGGAMGQVYILDTLTVKPTAGKLGSSTPGTGGAAGGSDKHYFTGRALVVACGGGGGGGGGGVTTDEAMAIGGGGGGGGGGGSGGSGGMDAIESGSDGDERPPTGGGGTGGTFDGKRGSGTVQTSRGSYSGGAGGAAGAVGVRGGDGALYASGTATVSGGVVEDTVETHPFLERSMTFDFCGGTSQGATSLARSAYLYLTLPDAPIPDKPGMLFLGYFTGKNGTGTPCYDTTGAPLIDKWPYDADGTVLYAHWRACTPPEGALVVTTTTDGAFDPDASAITFRAAVTWAMLFPDLRGADGTPSKITFSDSLDNGKAERELSVSVGQVRVGEARFTKDHPLIIEAPDRETLSVTLKGTGTPDRILDIGADNVVEISSLGFKNGASADEGGAIKLKGGTLRLTDCVFSGNAAATSGGAVYAAASERLTIENCRFENNTASSAREGGGAVFGGSNLVVIDSTFWQNEGTFGGGIWCGGTNVIVNSSILKNTAWQTGAGIYAGGSNDQVAVINCTLCANSANSQESLTGGERYDGGGGLFAQGGGKGCIIALVNDFFIGNALSSLTAPDVLFGTTNDFSGLTVCASMFGEADEHIRPSLLYNVSRGWDAGEFFESGNLGLTYRESVKRGVTATFLRTMKTIGDYGYSIFHDERWDNVAIAASSNGVKTALLGRAAFATTLLEHDISTRDLTRYLQRSQCGSYWFLRDDPKWGLIVTTAEDVDDWYDGDLSLREAIDYIATAEEEWFSNRVDGVYTITFSPKLAGKTIYLASSQCDVYGTANASNETGNVNIVVDGEANGITIDGSQASVPYRAFRVRRGAAFTLRNLTVANCTGTPYGLQPMPGCDGGALVNQGTTTVERCTFENCAGGRTASNPSGFGGALCNGPMQENAVCSLTVRDSVFNGCRAAQGGAVYNYPSNVLSLAGCTFTGNSAKPGLSSVFVAAGGAAYNGKDAELVVSGCTFANNTVLLDGKEVPNDLYGKIAEPHYTVSCVGAAVSKVALNAVALPDEESVTLDTTTGAAMPDGSPAVTMSPTGLTPGLSYALGYSSDLKSFEASEGTWVRANAQGRLDEPLRAPAGAGCGFYRVFVRE